MNVPVQVHEYPLTASAAAGAATGRWVRATLEPVPQILSYAECPLVVLNADSLVGTP
jgi:hypothetical protein